VLERLGRYWGNEFPSEVLRFDCSKTLENARQEKVEIYARAMSALADMADSDASRLAKRAKRQLDAEARKLKLRLPAGTRTARRLADMIIERRRQMV